MSDAFLKAAEERGYKPVSWQDHDLFDPYYEKMNDHWCANTSFLNLWGWKESFPAFYKVYGDYILLLNYLRLDGYPTAAPCLGHYTNDGIKNVTEELVRDFEAFGYPLVLMDIVPWMLPYYQASGVEFELEDLRDLQDYVYTPEEFLEGMEAQDDRYRYRYFKRKFNYETVELTEDMADECLSFMDKCWCGYTECEECCGCLKQVVYNAVEHIKELQGLGVLVRVDGEAAGLCIVTCRNHLGIYQYKNAVNSIKGLNEYLLRECFERYLTDTDMINYTEDMGVESLRYYKEHLAPHYSLLSKYTLTRKV